ncbi:pantothenate kinase [Ehrlichia ruminantium]|uniref:type III pantothenate kinase n=1 Tax=Ehrlichia ruminantium TaxID=779 RepID=UPI0007A01FA3|nr:type III pantothenate kinase [Ehrlichia ruminantium]KYW96920.1 type III pantothenate kinase [Ehrlichia ruminantium]QLK50256.1 type III pantothenate kinase [Ehrlichia ruminantium]QLK51181.1 type III pantothenate kinase [Ehrlichia ruminantium]QLK52104.1 type III pantothenate kinase [Ehrlichia ruminantium]QLK53015.1 type III pantothenate kinase [Ehrlichia ruminantium]
MLIIDIGNTNIKFGICINNQIIQTLRISSQPRRTADEYFFFLNTMRNQLNINNFTITHIIISSVVPSITKPMIELSTHYFNITPTIINNQHADICNIKIDLNDKLLGSDRLASIIGAVTLYPNKNLLVISMGTATVFNLISKERSIYGQVITPGAHIMAQSMRQHTALLPEISQIKVNKVVHNTLFYAIEAGVYWGYIAMVEGIVKQILHEENKDLHIVATGGNSILFIDHKNFIKNIDPDLTMKGMIYLHNMLFNK